MIRLQGQYRLTFPVTPGEVSFKGYGNDIESQTSITLVTKNQISAMRPKAISFDFFLPGNIESSLIEVEGYQGPRAWLEGLERLSGKPVLLTIDELNLAWNVLVGPCDGKFSGMNADFHGSIEFPLFIKEEFITWSNSKQLLAPAAVISKQVKQRPNTTGKTSPKKTVQISKSLQDEQLKRIEQKLRLKNLDE
ncbi:hypothetical protein [Brevibacillus sp. SYSU BS000544]|uniref:hypothetical protein n=1 Tax=Brevibacillus sp. SYSU BS000544 TaxID=3416443 RepID=UPI003CE467AC